jgi:hypothetical protein
VGVGAGGVGVGGGGVGVGGGGVGDGDGVAARTFVIVQAPTLRTALQVAVEV